MEARAGVEPTYTDLQTRHKHSRPPRTFTLHSMQFSVCTIFATLQKRIGKSVRSVVQCNALEVIVQTILTMPACHTRNIFFTLDEPRNHPRFGAVTQLLLCVL